MGGDIERDKEGEKYIAAGEKRLASQKGDTCQFQKGNLVIREGSSDVVASKMYKTIAQREMTDGAIAILWEAQTNPGQSLLGRNSCNRKKR